MNKHVSSFSLSVFSKTCYHAEFYYQKWPISVGMIVINLGGIGNNGYLNLGEGGTKCESYH